MQSKNLNLLLVQSDIIWEDITANLVKYRKMIADAGSGHDIILLPEMFSTGFSMKTAALAETMDGKSIRWMKECSHSYQCCIGGSLMIREEGYFYNRFIWVDPEGRISHYDKRHLFSMGGEDRHYHRGEDLLNVHAGAFIIRPLVCYDLRFPVWSRRKEDYDLLIYVANWPAARHAVWTTLLKARALENQSYVIGLNRVGSDGEGISYRGDSMVVNARGEEILHLENSECFATVSLSLDDLQQFRKKFPVWKDADPFTLS